MRVVVEDEEQVRAVGLGKLELGEQVTKGREEEAGCLESEKVLLVLLVELFAELAEESVDLLVDVLGLLEDVAKVFASFSYKS